MQKTILGSVLFAVTFADPALAQSTIDATTPTSLQQAMLAGLRNPVVGLIPVAAAIAVGCLAAAQRNAAALIASYVVAGVIGACAQIGERTVANAEIFAALAAVALGLMVFRSTPLRRDLIVALFGGAGLVVGYWLGAPLAAAQRTPVVGYLAGLLAIQLAVALTAMFGVRVLAPRPMPQLLAMRVIGAFAVGTGAAMLLQRYAAGG